MSDYPPSSNPSLPTSTALQQGPRVHRAALDMDKARLLLVFSHPVTFSSIDPTALLLVGNVSTNSTYIEPSTKLVPPRRHKLTHSVLAYVVFVCLWVALWPVQPSACSTARCRTWTPAPPPSTCK